MVWIHPSHDRETCRASANTAMKGWDFVDYWVLKIELVTDYCVFITRSVHRV
jgi:hypothetical protein